MLARGDGRQAVQLGDQGRGLWAARDRSGHPQHRGVVCLGRGPDKERVEGRGPSPQDALRQLALRLKELKG